MERKINILLCEQDENLRIFIAEFFRMKEYRVEEQRDCEVALSEFRRSRFDICILDTTMPEMGGLELGKKMREINPAVPFVLIAPKGSHDDMLDGFKAGADDYMERPPSVAELHYRVEAILRRTFQYKPPPKNYFRFAGYEFDVLRRTLRHGEVVQSLTAKETDLLAFFLSNCNMLIPRELAVNSIWAPTEADFPFKSCSMNVYIARLRSLFADTQDVFFHSVRGRGYKMTVLAAVEHA